MEWLKVVKRWLKGLLFRSPFEYWAQNCQVFESAVDLPTFLAFDPTAISNQMKPKKTVDITKLDAKQSGILMSFEYQTARTFE